MHKVALHFTISSVGTREMAMGVGISIRGCIWVRGPATALAH